MDIDNPILEARTSLAMTKTALAKALGVNLSTVWRWEKGQLPISPVVKRALEQLVAEKGSAA
ncbi:helix-turn-helix domain-containing protein [Mesorhizobium caraganae]|uniref:helix-turn-helix domain-containing protein n=1 Tax=Mesorhizobium caraganae TaxID=483206 RepID=UPI00177B249D|nr:helix-turn-helix domain-containing protein [Mesorhizobium caraganae]